MPGAASGTGPVIVMESLHDAYWPAGVFGVPGTDRHPVVWKPGHVELLMGALDALGHVAPPASLLPLEDLHQLHWPRIAEAPGLFDDPRPSRGRLVGTGTDRPPLGEDALELQGQVLVHNDVRSDNMCFRGSRVVLVDWSDARRGAAGFDLANLLQTLRLERGPEPQNVLPDARSVRRVARWRDGLPGRRSLRIGTSIARQGHEAAGADRLALGSNLLGAATRTAA